jgi:hypothetical protein
MPALVSLRHRASYAPVKPSYSATRYHGTPMTISAIDVRHFELHFGEGLGRSPTPCKIDLLARFMLAVNR